MLFAYALSSESTEAEDTPSIQESSTVSTDHPPEGARGDQTAQTLSMTEPDVIGSIAPPPEQPDQNEGSKFFSIAAKEKTPSGCTVSS